MAQWHSGTVIKYKIYLDTLTKYSYCSHFYFKDTKLQKVDKDWPLVIDDDDYRQHHVILKPGDMFFYEGARLRHGRPFEFIGDSFANIFCHFSPIDYIPRKRV
jgi:hypothetical protein